MEYKVGDEVVVHFMPELLFIISEKKDSFDHNSDPFIYFIVDCITPGWTKSFEVEAFEIKHSLSHKRNKKLDNLLK